MLNMNKSGIKALADAFKDMHHEDMQTYLYVHLYEKKT